MKKIAIFDPYLPRFTQDMTNWFANHDYEVKTDRYYDPELVEWADIVWFDTCDNNLLSATNPGQAIQGEKFYEGRTIPWDMHEMDLSKKQIIVRPIDIEVWQGHHAYSNMWDVVDDCIFLNPTIRDIMMADSRPHESDMNIHVIQCGIDLDRWKYKTHSPGFDIAVVAERWVSKGTDYMLQIAFALKFVDERYKIHWLGKDNDYLWEREYMFDFIKRNKLNVQFYDEYAEDLDTWLEDKDYLLSCSKKEAFGYNIAEAMAKGIKPIIHHFHGAGDVWPGMTWDNIASAVYQITNDEYDSSKYLKYLKDRKYTIDGMMEQVCKILL